MNDAHPVPPSPRATSAASPASSTSSTPAQPPDEGPSDRTTVTAVVNAYREAGFAGDFAVEEATQPDGTVRAVVRCGRCASSLDPQRITMHSIRRLEGASDPADMVAVIAATCPVCANDGTVVVAFGPMASAADSAVLVAMRDERDDEVLPPAMAPGERSPGATGHVGGATGTAHTGGSNTETS